MGQSPGRSLLVVGAALVDDLAAPRRLLAARRSAPASLAGGWELPGGKVEPGESPETALDRELREELGVGLVIGGEVLSGGPGSTWLLPGVGVLRVWWARAASGEPRPLEDHDELRWLDLDDWATGVPWLPADLPVVAALHAAAVALARGSGALREPRG